MSVPIAPRDRYGFKLAIICATQVEAESVRAVFDKCWEHEGRRYGKASGDKNTYTTGVIGRCNVVLVLLSSLGSIPAAQAAASLSSSFPKIELVFSIGICRVVPVHPETKEEIILGDVVVSTAVTQYDYGRMYPEGFKRKSSVPDSLRKAPKEIQGLMNKLEMRQNRQKLRANLVQLVKAERFQTEEPTAVYPGAVHDHLYEPTYLHQHQTSGNCDVCHNGMDPTCSRDCSQLGCKKEKLVSRKRLQPSQGMATSNLLQDPGPVVHFGRFGSANTMMRSGVDRDRLAEADELIAFEMEGAGMWDEHATIVIRGACDYADGHKNRVWQPYAAMMAAACFKIILAEWVVADEPVNHNQPLIASTQQTLKPLAHPEDSRSISFNSGGGAQTNNVSSHIQQQVNNNSTVSTQYFNPVTVMPEVDLRFQEPIGICLGQAPYIEPELFIGRESELRQMNQYLVPGRQSRSLCRLVIGGIGGIGKTQLAIAYTNHHRDDYTSVFWLNATSQATLQDDMLRLARHIFGVQKVDSLTGEQAVACVHRWLSHLRNTRWLLIFDNYNDPDQYMLQQYYPPVSHGSVIVTTRRPDRVAGQKIWVKPLQDIRESLEILATRSEREAVRDDFFATALARRFAGLPLALATAGGYLQTSHLSFQDYHREYEARWNVDPFVTHTLQEYQGRTLYTTWGLSFNQLECERPFSAQLLRLLAYFDNRCIWYELLRAGNPDGLEWLQDVMFSEAQFGSVMRTLTNYSFVELQCSTRTWSMHNCVHDWTLGALNEPVDAQQYQYAFTCFTSSVDYYIRNDLCYVPYSALAAHAARLVHDRFWQNGLLYKPVRGRLHEACRHISKLLERQVHVMETQAMFKQALAGFERALGLENKEALNATQASNVFCAEQDLLLAE